MKLKLKSTPEQVELIKQIGSKDLTKAAEASEVFAAFLGPVIQEVIRQAGTLSAIYGDSEYDEDDSPSYPLDLYYDQSDGYVKVWSQNIAGGLPSSLVEGMKEMKIATYRLDSAVSFLKKYARRGRLDIVSKAIERMAQEVLVKQERNGWAVIMKALAEASTLNGRADTSSSARNHVLQSNTGNVFVLDDMNRLLTLQKRLFMSFAGGTPDSSRGITDLFVSPEILQQVRAFAYNPMNTTAGVTTDAGGGSSGITSDAIALPDSMREGIYRGAGMGEIYGISLHEVLELGVGQKYNTLFDTFAASTVYPVGGSTFASTDEILVGLDASRDAFLRPVARQHDSGGQWTVLPDDQWVSRSEKTGFYGYLEEGRVCIDARCVVGIIV